MIVSVKNNRYIMGQLMGYIYIYYNGIYHEIFSLADGLIWWMFFFLLHASDDNLG